MSLFQIDQEVKSAMKKADQLHYFREPSEEGSHVTKTIHLKKDGTILLTLKAETWIDKTPESFTTSLVSPVSGGWGAICKMAKAGDELLIHIYEYPIYGTNKRVKELLVSLYRNDKPIVKDLLIEQEFHNMNNE